MKPKKCRVCGYGFSPWTSLQKVCSPACAVKLVRLEAEKAERKVIKAWKAKNKPKSQWVKEAQAEFNRYIRLRDHDQPCISCQRQHAGQYHAGHYRTTKAAPQLRFDETNCHRQCAPCNSHLSGNITEYRINLLTKIGEERLKWLEANNDLKRWTVDELKALKLHYRKAANDLQKQLEDAA